MSHQPKTNASYVEHPDGRVEMITPENTKQPVEIPQPPKAKSPHKPRGED